MKKIIPLTLELDYELPDGVDVAEEKVNNFIQAFTEIVNSICKSGRKWSWVGRNEEFIIIHDPNTFVQNFGDEATVVSPLGFYIKSATFTWLRKPMCGLCQNKIEQEGENIDINEKEVAHCKVKRGGPRQVWNERKCNKFKAKDERFEYLEKPPDGLLSASYG